MNNLNEYDITKSMLKTIRCEKHIIKESSAIPNPNFEPNSNFEIKDTDNKNDNLNGSDEEDLTSAELSEEQKSFRDTVSPRVEFNSFTVYPKNKNVIFSGKFKNLGGLEWQFTLEDTDGLYISVDNAQITNDTLNTIKKLKGYYDNWADKWAEKIATEYNRNTDNDETQRDESV